MAVWQAQQQGIKNFSVLVSHVLVPPAIASILQSPLNRVQGFLGPGHVCTVMGYREYEPIAERYNVLTVIGIAAAGGRASPVLQQNWSSRNRIPCLYDGVDDAGCAGRA